MREFLPYPDRRNMRAQRLTAEIMQELSPFLQGEQHRYVVRAIETLLWRKGVEIVTDYDRQELGLPERGNDGWTADELRILELKRQELMLNPFRSYIVKDQPSMQSKTEGIAP